MKADMHGSAGLDWTGLDWSGVDVQVQGRQSQWLGLSGLQF